MTIVKKLMIATALFAGGSSLAMAQNGNPTGGYPPVMGGAGGNPAVRGPAYFPEGSAGQAPQKDLHVSKVAAVEWSAGRHPLLPDVSAARLRNLSEATN